MIPEPPCSYRAGRGPNVGWLKSKIHAEIRYEADLRLCTSQPGAGVRTCRIGPGSEHSDTHTDPAGRGSVSTPNNADEDESGQRLDGYRGRLLGCARV